MGTNDLAALKPSTGYRLMAGYVYDDTLTIDLYGTTDSDGAVQVETVMVGGTQHEITTLFSGKQLENLGYYIELKDSKLGTHRDWARRYQCEAQRY